MSERWRCLATGCNPVLNAESAPTHKESTGHRVAKWPVRSAEGKRRAKARNRTGYYDKYNVGDKSYANRLGDPETSATVETKEWDYNDTIHPFEDEAFG